MTLTCPQQLAMMLRIRFYSVLILHKRMAKWIRDAQNRFFDIKAVTEIAYILDDHMLQLPN